MNIAHLTNRLDQAKQLIKHTQRDRLTVQQTNKRAGPTQGQVPIEPRKVLKCTGTEIPQIHLSGEPIRRANRIIAVFPSNEPALSSIRALRHACLRLSLQRHDLQLSISTVCQCIQWRMLFSQATPSPRIIKLSPCAVLLSQPLTVVYARLNNAD